MVSHILKSFWWQKRSRAAQCRFKEPHTQQHSEFLLGQLVTWKTPPHWPPAPFTLVHEIILHWKNILNKERM